MSNDNYHDEGQTKEPSEGVHEPVQEAEPVLQDQEPEASMTQEPGQEGEAAPTEQTPEEKIAALEVQIVEVKDQYLRKAADFENFRKRMNREKQEAIDFANQSLLVDLIQILDDFERALKSAETSQDFTSFYEGIGMIEKRLSSQLEHKWGLKRFDSAGERFDPNRHEAIMMEKSEDITEPVVQEDFIKGYSLKDRVIRSAKVKVLMPESSETSSPKTESSDTGDAGSDECV